MAALGLSPITSADLWLVTVSKKLNICPCKTVCRMNTFHLKVSQQAHWQAITVSKFPGLLNLLLVSVVLRRSTSNTWHPFFNPL